MDVKNFSQNLTYLRQTKELTTAELAKEIKISEETIIGWESGLAEPTVKDITKLSKFFGVDTGNLVNSKMGRKIKKREPLSKKAYIMQIVLLVLSGLTFISFAFSCFIHPGLKPEFQSISFFEILFNVVLTFKYPALYWLMLLVVIYNIVNPIILISSKTIRNSLYYKISQIILAVLNIHALIIWIVVCALILIGGMYLSFTAIWLILVLSAMLICMLVTNLNKTLKRENLSEDELCNRKLNNRGIIKNVVIYTLLGLAVAIMIYVICYLLSGEYEVHCNYYDIYGVNIFKRLEYQLSNSPMMYCLIPFAVALFAASLLMIKKINNNKIAKIALSIVGIFSSVSLIITNFVTYFLIPDIINNYCISIPNFDCYVDSLVIERVPKNMWLFVASISVVGILLITIFILSMIKRKKKKN